MKMRESGSAIPSLTVHAPFSQDTVGTSTSLGLMNWRKTCCRIRLIPQVASRVSSGRL